eukprot:scaffold23961_cov131-Isochrysis_galbana.AAC.5
MTRRDKQQARLVRNIATNNRHPIRSNMPADGTVHGGRYTKVKALGKGSHQLEGPARGRGVHAPRSAR